MVAQMREVVIFCARITDGTFCQSQLEYWSQSFWSQVNIQLSSAYRLHQRMAEIVFLNSNHALGCLESFLEHISHGRRRFHEGWTNSGQVHYFFCLLEPIHGGTDLVSTFCFPSGEDAGIPSWQMQEEPRMRQRVPCLQLSLLHPSDWALSRGTQSLGRWSLGTAEQTGQENSMGLPPSSLCKATATSTRGGAITPKWSSYPRVLRARPRPPQVTKG